MTEAPSEPREQPLALLELPWPAMQAVMHWLGPSGALQLGRICRDLQKHVSCMTSPLWQRPRLHHSASPAATAWCDLPKPADSTACFGARHLYW